MNTNLSDFLGKIQADPDTIQQALRMHLAERTDDLTPEEMLAQLQAIVSEEKQLEQQLMLLKSDSNALTEVALEYFEHTWDDETQNPSIQAAFTHAKEKLPVIESAILAIVVMYAMYLLVTEGVTEETETTEKRPDGTIKRRKKVKREPFGPVGAAVAQLFGK